jgi:hypothetical protein
VLWLVLFKPQDFWGGIARKHPVSRDFDEFVSSAEFGFELLALFHG